VNGYTTGSITLTSSDIAEGSNLYFTNARVRSAVDAFLTGEAPLSYNVSNGKMGIAQSGTNSNGYLSSTDWNTFNNKLSSFINQTANTFYAAPNGITGVPSFRTLVAADIPTLNQNTTGNAATADAFVNTRNINGVGFNGTADITISANTPNAISFNSSGTGTNTPTSFNGSNSVTISYNSIGASPLVGSTSLTTLGTISAGTWNGIPWTTSTDFFIRRTQDYYNGTKQILSTPFMFHFGLKPGKTGLDKFIDRFGPKGAFKSTDLT
jgi:hypothetical protein